MTEQPSDLVTMNQAVKRFNKSYSTLTRWMNAGVVTKHKFGGKIYLSDKELRLAIIGKLSDENEKTGNETHFVTNVRQSEQPKRASFEAENSQTALYERTLDRLEKQLDMERGTRDRLEERITELLEDLRKANEEIYAFNSILASLPRVLPEKTPEPEPEPIAEAEPVLKTEPPKEPEPKPYHQDKNIFGDRKPPERKKRSISPFKVRDRVAGIMGWE
jgi:hypothetical protein